MSKYAGRTGHPVGYDAASAPSITHSMRVVGESAAEASAEARIDATLVPIGGVRPGATSAWPRHGPPTKQRQLGLKMAGAASKGGRFSTFKTRFVPANPSVFQFQTSDQLPYTARVGRHGLGPATPWPAATPVAPPS